MYDHIKSAVMEIVAEVVADEAGALKALKGRDSVLRPSKPKDPLYAYIWRWARFHSGQDCHMPVMEQFWLQTGLEERLKAKGHTKFRDADPTRPWQKVDRVSSGDISKDVTGPLDQMVDSLLVQMKLSRFAGALRWKGLIY